MLALRVLLFAAIVALIPLEASAQLTEADVYVQQAVLEIDAQRYAAALEHLARALAMEPNHVEALYYTGLVHMAERRPQEAVSYLDRARAGSPTEPSIAYQLGLAYFALERYEQAAPLLEGVFRTNPDLDGVGYYVGFLRYRAKDYRGALAAFRAGRATDPEIQKLTRFYVALALGVLGLTTQAAAEVDQALRLAPGSPLTGPAERLRDRLMAARQQERRLGFEMRFGAFYDDNVAVRPDPERRNREPLLHDLREADHETVGQILAARVDYAWLKQDAWDGTVGYLFFGSYYDELPSFNVTNHVVNAALTRRGSLLDVPVSAGTQYAYDVLFLNEEELVQRHTANLFAVVTPGDRHLTQLLSRLQVKAFHERNPVGPREDRRDADNWMLGATHILRFAQDRHFLKLGCQWDYEDASGRNWEYVGQRLLAGGQVTLPWWDVRLKYDIDVHVRDYQNRQTIVPSFAPGTRRRQDEEITQVVRAELPLRWLAVAGSQLFTERSFTLSLEFQHTDARSNLSVFDYTRNVASLVLSWTY